MSWSFITSGGIKYIFYHCKRFSEQYSMSLHLLQGCLNFELIESCTHPFFPLYSPAMLLFQIVGFGNHV